MTNSALEVKNLTKDYGDFVLDKLNFTLPRGVIMGLIGENGAGKSTTINCILNEIQKDDGEILIFGKDHISNEIEIKSKLGVVFDENHFPDIFTPMEIGKYMAGIYSGWEWATYRQFLEKFELPKDKKIKDFSKGMKVKLAFAVALSHKAELLILDEATSGLDPIIRDDVLDMLIDFVQDENHSVLVSSHITSDLEKVADYITFIHKGKLVFSHDKDDLVDNYGIVSCGSVIFDTLDKTDTMVMKHNRRKKSCPRSSTRRESRTNSSSGSASCWSTAHSGCICWWTRPKSAAWIRRSLPRRLSRDAAFRRAPTCRKGAAPRASRV